MKCGWGCGAQLTGRSIRAHCTICAKRPAASDLGDAREDPDSVNHAGATQPAQRGRSDETGAPAADFAPIRKEPETRPMKAKRAADRVAAREPLPIFEKWLQNWSALAPAEEGKSEEDSTDPLLFPLPQPSFALCRRLFRPDLQLPDPDY